MNMWIAIALLLYCFGFEEYAARPINTMIIPQFIGDKKPYDVNIKVRSPKHVTLIERDCLEAVTMKY